MAYNQNHVVNIFCCFFGAIDWHTKLFDYMFQKSHNRVKAMVALSLL